MARMTPDQKRLRRYARDCGKTVRQNIETAVRDVERAAFFAAHPSLADLAPSWLVMSDRAIELAAQFTVHAVRWARQSKEESR